MTWRERLLSLEDVWAVAALFVFVMGGIYVGMFTATEGAAMGAFGAMLFALWRRALTRQTLYAALLESARTTAMLFMLPFMWADVLRLIILVAFPILSLWLPGMMR